MLLREVTTADLANGIRTAMGSEVAAEVTEVALGFLRELFSESSQTGCQMAAAAVTGLESPETVAESCAALTQELLQEISSESQT